MLEPIRIRRTAVLAGLVFAVFVGAIFVARPVPNAVVSWFGGPGSSVERRGGLRVRFQPPPDAWPAFEQQLPKVAVQRDGDTLVLEFVSVTEEAVGNVFDVLEGGGLTLHEVRENMAFSRIPASGDVRADVESWSPENGGRHMAAFLHAPTRQALERGVAAAIADGWRITPESTIGYEHIEPSEYGDDSEPYWRTHELATEAVIDGSMIELASASIDPEMGRPVVLVDLTPHGSERFCSATQRLVGQKIAIVIGARVWSAPYLNSPICAGRAIISHSGTARDAEALAAALEIGALPAGGRVLHHEWVPATDVRAQEWAGRLLLGLAAGLAFGACMLLALRAARPSRPVREAAWAGRFPWRRLLVTLLGPFALIAGGEITMPGVNFVQFGHLSGETHSISVVTLGIAPILSAFVLVEIAALALPRLRWRRHDPRGRVALGQAAAALALAIAAVQSYFMASYLESLSGGGFEVVANPGLQFRLLTAATLTTATMLLAVVAGIIRERGLGNGYGVLFATGVLIDAGRAIPTDKLSAALNYDTGHVVGGITALAIALGTASVLRWRIATLAREPALRVPSSGVEPSHMFTLAFAIAFAATHGVAPRVSPELASHVGWQFAIMAISVPLWAWLFARPSLIAQLATDAGLDAPTRASWLRAMLASVLLLMVAYAMWLSAARAHANGAWPATPVAVMVCVAVALDIAADARAHRCKLAVVAVLHQIQRAGVIERVLADASIPCHIHAGHLRTLFAFFGPWAPAIVLVPEERAAEARAKIDDATHPALSVFS